VTVEGVDVREVVARQYGDDAVSLLGGCGIHGADLGVRHRATQDRPMEHAWEPDVAGELGLAGELERAVGAFDALSYDAHRWSKSSTKESSRET
jgi:hypothetical protein